MGGLRTSMRAIALWILAGSALCSCVQKMAEDGHLRTYGSTAPRQPPAGTIARGGLKQDPVYFEGRTPDGALVPKLPMRISRELLRRGQERFNIYCAPCHDFTGSGNGMIVQRGFLAPPSFHIDRLRSAPDGHFFDVLSRGYGAMYSYGDRVPVADRWAIVSYIRALQLSENARLSDLQPDEQRKLLEKSE